jgi:hypothetical protein
MNFKKTVAIATAAGALAAISVPAMALENEFHGMYRAYGYVTNALSGAGAFNLKENSRVDRFLEQRARLQYTAKANDDLKLVTHFELDTKFGGSTNAKYANAGANGSDAGTIDADRVTLETKNVYLDFNCPITGSNVKVGIQPFSDAYSGTFSNFDGAGVAISKKFSALTASYAYFGIQGDSTTFPSYNKETHLNAVDAKFAVNKDITVGANYYNVIGPDASLLFLNMVGVNAAAKIGPAALTASLGYQFGDSAVANTVVTNNKKRDISAIGATVAAKIDVGVGKVSVSGLYLTGDNGSTTDKKDTGWQVANAATTYFPAANMWLITRNAATINSSTAIGGSSDLTRGGRGIVGVFAGFDGTAGKVFYNANLGYAEVASKRAADSASIGTELNATAGYKLYDNLSASFTAAYAILGDGYNKNVAAGKLLAGGVAKADDPFLTNIALNYTF